MHPTSASRPVLRRQSCALAPDFLETGYTVAYRGHLSRMYSFRPGVRRRGLVAGDGFLKNIGKAIKKIQPGKILGKVANIASPILGSVPIVGGLYKAALAVGKASGDPRYANVDPGTGYIGGSQSMASTAATT